MFPKINSNKFTCLDSFKTETNENSGFKTNFLNEGFEKFYLAACALASTGMLESKNYENTQFLAFNFHSEPV